MAGQTEEVYHFTQICEALYRRGTMENKMIVKYSNKMSSNGEDYFVNSTVVRTLEVV